MAHLFDEWSVFTEAQQQIPDDGRLFFIQETDLFDQVTHIWGDCDKYWIFMLRHLLKKKEQEKEKRKCFKMCRWW